MKLLVQQSSIRQLQLLLWLVILQIKKEVAGGRGGSGGGAGGKHSVLISIRVNITTTTNKRKFTNNFSKFKEMKNNGKCTFLEITVTYCSKFVMKMNNNYTRGSRKDIKRTILFTILKFLIGWITYTLRTVVADSKANALWTGNFSMVDGCLLKTQDIIGCGAFPKRMEM